MTYLKNKIKLLHLLIFVFILTPFSMANSKIYEEIKVSGNERLSVETIIMFSGLKIGDDIDNNDLNLSIKNLYKTNYFKDIKILPKNKIIEITIVENPIIQSIKINGIKRKPILNELIDITKKNEKYPYLKNKILEQNNLLLNIVRASGFYFAKVNTKIMNNDNNSVDLIYNFELGEIAKIKKIKFVGNKIFRDNTLRNVVKSEEGSFWKFITSDKYLDERKIKNDEKLLEKYYQRKGYYNVKIKSSYAKNIDNQYFQLIFNIDAGTKYFSMIYQLIYPKILMKKIL